jgi:hypothetical protein
VGGGDGFVFTLPVPEEQLPESCAQKLASLLRLYTGDFVPTKLLAGAMRAPGHITKEEFLELLQRQAAELEGDDLAWWSAHKVDPFTIQVGSSSHFAAARSGANLVVFFDDEDEFGHTIVGPGGEMHEPGLFGDLVDAVRGVRAL